MKIVCKKSNLVKGVSIVSKAVPSKTTMPILECILIDATTDIIRLTANDMELGIQTDIEGEILERGMIAIDAKTVSYTHLINFFYKMPLRTSTYIRITRHQSYTVNTDSKY